MGSAAGTRVLAGVGRPRPGSPPAAPCCRRFSPGRVLDVGEAHVESPPPEDEGKGSLPLHLCMWGPRGGCLGDPQVASACAARLPGVLSRPLAGQEVELVFSGFPDSQR